MHRNIEIVERMHRNQEAGWGKTREERERRNENRRKRHAGDRRLVVDEQGTVCYAVDYEGNVAEGMARYEAECGPQPVGMTNSPPDIDSNEIPRVADFAIWSKEEKRKKEGFNHIEAVTMGLSTQGDRANNQNEIGPGSKTQLSGNTFGRATPTAGGGLPDNRERSVSF